MAKRITIDGVEYAPVAAEGERMRIVLCDNRGLMFVGRCDLSGDGEIITIRDARCVVYWGTTRHIAELAAGPTSKTKLGMPADVHVFRRNLVAYYDCGEGWK